MSASEQLNIFIRKVALYDDAIAYKKLFLHYHQRLVQFSTAITHSRESAEEVVSDVFMKIWINRQSLMRIDNFPLYLYITTKNISINRFLKDKKRTSFSLEEVSVKLQSLSLDPEKLLISAEMCKRIQQSVNELPARCQLVFKLIKEDGLSYRETAELLDLSLKTVENQMTIAFRKIGESIRLDWPALRAI